MIDFSRRNESGFTLVELTISLMVIGLLIGAVLKGQELIENARVTRAVKDVHDIEAAVITFQNMFDRALPGDLRNAGTRLPDCGNTPTAWPCNNTTSIPGNALSVGNGLLSGPTKARNFWVHLNRAGLIPSIHEDAEPASVSPRNPFDGFYNVDFGNTMLPGTGGTIPFNNLRLESIPPTSMFLKASQILAIDRKMDDGKPTTGRVVIFNNTACYDSTTLSYIISDTGCRIFINIFH